MTACFTEGDEYIVVNYMTCFSNQLFFVVDQFGVIVGSIKAGQGVAS